ncbi:MAG TPA: biotin--[acetyl-CoA-carboxylase] ligase [Chthoniobacterales bacterium]|jgi:BirA family transcriptional regulator, biotin operon repressor / biotin---[acetyl-CoA-carboxylase] ligase|nr:biotin--[acetyl-CoA-carboxylase] ligase [Chthoniobacterales bacterium]
MSATDALNADKIRADVDSAIIGREIFVLDETTSTNDAVLERVSSATREGLTVFAERQTAGRGQRSNSWESAPRFGLWFSFLLRPKIDIAESPRLAEWTARTIAQTISKKFTLPATVKLPNDVMLAGKKVAGVLVEMRAQKNGPHIAIVGIGVNINHQAEDFSNELRERAISLAIALDRQIDRQQFAIALLKNLDRTYSEVFARNS